MTGFEAGALGGEPTRPPSPYEQTEFFGRAIIESHDMAYEPRLVRGPHHAAFNSILGDITSRAVEIDPSLTAENIAPPDYQSAAAQLRHSALSGEQRQRVASLRDAKVSALKQYGIDRFAGYGKHKELIAPYVLDTPPQASQGDSRDGFIDPSRLCVNACFRMIFAGIAGWMPSEAVLHERMQRFYGNAISDDGAYFKIFNTDAFRAICDRKVQMVEILGGELEMIGRFAGKLKERQPDAKVFSMVSLGSVAATGGVWHSNILLNATDTVVTVRDPSHELELRKRIYQSDFSRNWAVAYNRAQLAVVT